MFRNTRATICMVLLGFLSACGGGGGGPAPKPPYAGIKIGRPYEIYGHWYNPKYDAHYDEIGTASWYGPGFHGGHTANGERFDQYAMTAAHRTLPMPSIVRVTNLDNGLSTIVKINDRGPFARDRIIDLSRAAAKNLGIIRTGTAKVRVQFLDQETREYVQNMQNGTQYAMREMNRVNPAEAGTREEAGAKPTLRIESRMFAESNTPMSSPQHSVFSVIDKDKDDEVVSPADLKGSPRITPASYTTPVPREAPALSSPDNTGYFIQAGTFTSEDNALSLIDRIDDVDGPQIMEVSINGKKLYRVMIGPYENHGIAKNMLSKLASIGIPDAKIIHN